MTSEQMQILAAHIIANTDQEVVDALAVGNDTAIANWYNQRGTTKAWGKVIDKDTMFGALNLTSYDGLSAGKRDAFRLIFDNAPVDFTNDKIRAGMADIFNAVDEVAMLNAGTVMAYRIEEVFGGDSVTSSTVTAIKRNYYGTVAVDDVSRSLNTYGGRG